MNHATEVTSLGERAIIFLKAGEELQAIESRFIGWWIPAYYLLFHSLELATKTILYSHGIKPQFVHDVFGTIIKYKSFFNLSRIELKSIKELQDLNSGPGGLRYPNIPKGQFLPSYMREIPEIVEKLLKSVGINRNQSLLTVQ